MAFTYAPETSISGGRLDQRCVGGQRGFGEGGALWMHGGPQGCESQVCEDERVHHQGEEKHKWYEGFIRM